MPKGRVFTVTGGQTGSEGKGRVAAFLTLQENISYVVRAGGTNAGHSLTFEDGSFLSARQLSMAGILSGTVKLVIPAGALIDLDVLKSEMERFRIYSSRILVDRNAMIIEKSDIEAESNLGLFNKLSSTQSGVGSASARRIMRGKDVRLARDVGDSWFITMVCDTSTILNNAIDDGQNVLIEGTQGFGLSLYHSPWYPCTTSRDTSAASFVSEAGISPLLITDIILVMRAYQIRVSGQQAGPLHQEMTWEELMKEAEYPYDITEMTSVTKKVRRVGRFDFELAKRAVMVNRPTALALVSLDYIDYQNKGVKEFYNLTDKAKEFINKVESELNTPVRYIGTGPKFSEFFYCPGKTNCQTVKI